MHKICKKYKNEREKETKDNTKYKKLTNTKR